VRLLIIPLGNRNALVASIAAYTDTTLATDVDDNPVGYENYYQMLLSISDNGTVGKLGDSLFEGGELTPTNLTVTYTVATDAANDTLAANIGGTYYSFPDSLYYTTGYSYDSDDDEYDIPIQSVANFTHTYVATLNGTLQLNSVTVPSPEGSATEDLLPPGDAEGVGYDFGPPPILGNIGGRPVLANPYGYEESNNTLATLVNSSLAYAQLTADGGNTESSMYALNSLGLGLTSIGQPWLNGNILAASDCFPEWALNEDGSLNVAAIMPEGGFSGNATFYFTTISGISLLANGYVYDPDTYTDTSVLLVPAALAVDNNRDGNISFDVDDKTSEENPFVFWINNNKDRTHLVDASSALPQLNDRPQPQVLAARGLRTSKPLPCRPSSKWTEEPSMRSRLAESIRKVMPWDSWRESPSLGSSNDMPYSMPEQPPVEMKRRRSLPSALDSR
jgi:hypothetical protein